ncbi:MAG: redoxin domain-containing protein [Candidatus Omnitrophica bacterium]|nr:redoxin domain-containing protein [Candidatus Omnitrophota bacterium]
MKLGTVLFLFFFAYVSVFVGPAQAQDAVERTIRVHLQEVFDAKVSVIPFNGLKAVYANPIGEVSGVKNGETATFKIPAEYLPGEFLLRLDYRAKETDAPYPAERNIFINKQDIELTVNPPYINNSDKTKFGAGEKENTIYSDFIKENSAKRMPIELLRQVLLSYDRPRSDFYGQAIKEFEQRRAEYNQWLGEQAKKYHDLYVARLFQFQHIPATAWSGSEKERLNQILKNYFDGIDLSDPLIIRSRELSKFMDDYIRLYAMQATTKESRDALFTQAGRIACEKASKGHPSVYGWMADYFYIGYESLGIKQGMAMLEEHINNPNCLTSKKQQITKRLAGIQKLVPGALAPDFVIEDNEGNNFEFHKWRGKAPHKLLLFWSADCTSCQELVSGLTQWYNEGINKKKLDIVAVGLDETEAQAKRWEAAIADLPGWKHLYPQGGVNSAVARDYAILSTPAMFLIDSKSNKIVSVPDDLEQLIKDLK